MEWKPDEIKALRKKLSLSQSAFAKKLGVSRNLIFYRRERLHYRVYWESGRKSPSEDSLKRLAELAKTVSNSEEAVSKTVSNSEESEKSLTDGDRGKVTSDRPRRTEASPMPLSKFDPNYVTNVLKLLHGGNDGIVEVRIFPTERYMNINGRREYVGKTVSDYYTDVARIAQDVKPFG